MSGSVLIWRSSMLPASETFVRAQGLALTSWQPTFGGAVKVESPVAADSDLIVFPETSVGRRALLALKLTGRSALLRATLRRLRPDLVHAHFAGDGWMISAEAAESKIPLIVTVHGYDVTRLPRESGPRGVRYRHHLRTVFARASLILAVSSYIRDRTIELGADPAKVRVHHTGVALDPAPPAALAEKQWDLLFVGRFVEKKGVDDLLTAAAQVPGKPRMLLIGGGPLEGPMRQRAAELGLDATFLGPQDPDVVRRSMAESRIFVSPSKTAADGDSEGLPTTILEAASHGLPTVSTMHSGIPEAVRHNETGLLGTEGDPDALAANLRRLLADPALCDAMGERARAYVAEHFDLARQTAELEKFYDSVARPR
ncbi:glycosyltransferase [Hamadaea sp. NPDC051192]|uniref:glycosyltransferase n=1 Tax=Hamadaea sp. NPDC051192 TaxID=3154940 RepID=UPI0034175853